MLFINILLLINKKRENSILVALYDDVLVCTIILVQL
jgi:hypothetical protein